MNRLNKQSNRNSKTELSVLGMNEQLMYDENDKSVSEIFRQTHVYDTITLGYRTESKTGGTDKYKLNSLYAPA